jgi:hypothetical protein
MIKNVYKIALVTLAGLIGTANALEIRPLTEILFPTKVNLAYDKGGNKADIKWETDLVFMIGSEILVSPENIPIRFGGGLGYKSAQQKGSTVVTPATVPLWGTISYDPIKDKYAVSPYIVARAGTLAPLSSNGNWWELPLNFVVQGGVGVILPFNIGLEVNYDYTSLLKSYKSMDTKVRASSGRVGVMLSYGFNLSGDKKPAEEKSEKPYSMDAFQNNESNEPEPQQETSGFDYSGGAYDSSEPDTTATTSETDYGYGASEETPSEDTTASESTESTEPVAEEAPAEEPATEEAATEPEAESAAEPEPEPAAEPAPEPEPKPAVKKKSSKKSSKKSKKSSKRSSKKSSKKSKKKK